MLKVLLEEHIENASNNTGITLHKEPSCEALQDNSARLAFAPLIAKQIPAPNFTRSFRNPIVNQHQIKSIFIKYSQNYIIDCFNI